MPKQLSQRFQRFSDEFHSYIEKIIKYEYGLYAYPEKYTNPKSLKNEKHFQLIQQCKQLCRKYKGPHSVLQVFLEQIIECIGTIQQ